MFYPHELSFLMASSACHFNVETAFIQERLKDARLLNPQHQRCICPCLMSEGFDGFACEQIWFDLGKNESFRRGLGRKDKQCEGNRNERGNDYSSRHEGISGALFPCGCRLAAPVGKRHESWQSSIRYEVIMFEK
jgi:hypothetical protein